MLVTVYLGFSVLITLLCIDSKVWSDYNKTTCSALLNIRNLCLFYYSLCHYSAIKMPTIITCSVRVQIPQWLSHDLSRPGSSPTTLTVTHKELSMRGDGCVSPPASHSPSQLKCSVASECWDMMENQTENHNKLTKLFLFVAITQKLMSINLREKKSC